MTPRDFPTAIDQHMRGYSNFTSVRPTTGMTQIISMNDISTRVAKNFKRKFVFLNNRVRLLRRINRHRIHLTADFSDLVADFSELNQLRYARASPVSAIKHQQHRPACIGIAEFYHFALCIG